MGTLRFRGAVDRVDLDPASKVALVLDYKTGGARSYEQLKTSTLRPYAIREYGPSKPILPGLLLYLMTTPYVTNGYSAATRLSRE